MLTRPNEDDRMNMTKFCEHDQKYNKYDHNDKHLTENPSLMFVVVAYIKGKICHLVRGPPNLRA